MLQILKDTFDLYCKAYYSENFQHLLTNSRKYEKMRLAQSLREKFIIVLFIVI